jgi:hypothetical protein
MKISYKDSAQLDLDLEGVLQIKSLARTLRQSIDDAEPDTNGGKDAMIVAGTIIADRMPDWRMLLNLIEDRADGIFDDLDTMSSQATKQSNVEIRAELLKGKPLSELIAKDGDQK